MSVCSLHTKTNPIKFLVYLQYIILIKQIIDHTLEFLVVKIVCHFSV